MVNEWSNDGRRIHKLVGKTIGLIYVIVSLSLCVCVRALFQNAVRHVKYNHSRIENLKSK